MYHAVNRPLPRHNRSLGTNAEQLHSSGMGAPALADVLAIAQRITPQLANDSDVQEFAQLVVRASELQG